MDETWTFAAAAQTPPLEIRAHRGALLPMRFAPLAEEYRRARRAQSALLMDRSDRVVFAVSGRDRAAWLHNLLTNDIRGLAAGASCYAFAVDVRGRVQFDLHVLNAGDHLLLDLDRAVAPSACAHLERYLITEDARIEPRPAARLGVCGAGAAAVARALGADWAALPEGGQIEVGGATGALSAGRLWKNDFAGCDGFDLLVPEADAGATWKALAGLPDVQPAGAELLDVLRIEAGIPWLGRDLDERTLPPETGIAATRGIHYKKGCYLGQEVIERMRSHGSLARRLVRVRVEDGAGLTLPCPLLTTSGDAGRITSLVAHPDGGWIGLAYVRTSVAAGAELLAGDATRRVTFVA